MNKDGWRVLIGCHVANKSDLKRLRKSRYLSSTPPPPPPPPTLSSPSPIHSSSALFFFLHFPRLSKERSWINSLDFSDHRRCCELCRCLFKFRSSGTLRCLPPASAVYIISFPPYYCKARFIQTNWGVRSVCSHFFLCMPKIDR